MNAGFDRYYQIAHTKCFRDEVLRGDRQLWITRLTLETPGLLTEQETKISQKVWLKGVMSKTKRLK